METLKVFKTFRVCDINRVAPRELNSRPVWTGVFLFWTMDDRSWTANDGQLPISHYPPNDGSYTTVNLRNVPELVVTFSLPFLILRLRSVRALACFCFMDIVAARSEAVIALRVAFE